jgi:dCMP deaminase
MTDARPSWHEYFMSITELVAQRATCTRRYVGAILVRDKHIIATGYNGAPTGISHCLEVGCLREQQGIPSGERHELCRGLHAEQNAIIQAAYHGVSIKGGTMYCTFRPCTICIKMIINSGIQRVMFLGDYDDPLSVSMVEQSGLDLVKMGEEDPA